MTTFFSYLKCTFLYLKYLTRHRWFVFIECCKLGIPWLGLVHDLSKFLPDEWFPYLRHFYMKNDSRPEWILQYDRAWLKHQNRNRHHWQYWILWKDTGGVVVMDMPLKYRKEMLADWKGAGRAITGKDDVREFYLKTRDRVTLAPKTREWVEEQLNINSRNSRPGV